MANELEIPVIAQVSNIHHTARKIVVKTNHFVTVVQQTLAQVTS